MITVCMLCMFVVHACAMSHRFWQMFFWFECGKVKPTRKTNKTRSVCHHWYHWICKQGMSQVFMENHAVGYGRPAWTQQLCRLLTKSNYFVVGHARRVHRCHLHPLFHHLLWPQWIQWCPKLIKLLINLYILYCYFFWNQSMMRCDNCDMCDIVWHIHCK